jgi:hypothetical protein
MSNKQLAVLVVSMQIGTLAAALVIFAAIDGLIHPLEKFAGYLTERWKA